MGTMITFLNNALGILESAAIGQIVMYVIASLFLLITYRFMLNLLTLFVLRLMGAK